MERLGSFNGQEILTQDIEKLQLGKENAITERHIDFSNINIRGGIVKQAESFRFTPTTGISTVVNVGRGVAYDIEGKRIEIDKDLVYDAASVNRRNPDGIDAPASTGNINIPIPPPTVGSRTYHLWIAYLEVVDTTVPFHNPEDGNKIYYPHRNEGYKILVTEIFAYPTRLYVYLGSITVDSTSTIIAIDQDTNIVYATFDSKKILETLSADRTLRYATHSVVSLYDHLHAIGANPPTISNPHGLSAIDLGVADVADHIRQQHTDGIIGNYESTDSSLHGRTIGIEFEVVPLRAPELLLVNGRVFTPADTMGMRVGFGHLPLDGDYYYNIYFDSTNRVIIFSPQDLYPGEGRGVVTLSTILANPMFFLLYVLKVVVSGGGVTRILVGTDYRRFFTTNKVQAWTTVSRPVAEGSAYTGISYSGFNYETQQYEATVKDALLYKWVCVG